MTRDEDMETLAQPLSTVTVRLVHLAQYEAACRERDAARAWARRWKVGAKKWLRSQRDSLNDATELLARSTDERDALAARVAALEGALRGLVAVADHAIECGYFDTGRCDCGLHERLANAERVLAAPAAPGAGEGEG